ncbi:biopolymer transporter ExbB [Candidatus Endoriftia persephone str. Guaymas]|uniref:MotA/TolQ/ExbB proton channel family protein n=3 Tax=Gammaproteobacteria TaxID=1236 RepID=G2FFD6_9GAMM|nr:MotA/TolQ/ExbB proton channel family protein [Candidatus Endoriftia persephone]EGV52142.1 putative biopolymer transport protein [endosymbiont of Riftia pachyptila (vent Ph05)]EGW54514.1 MotA/TolQ/ExbB proton channel family protein [endosymbiont of Tevnia jerichonana (vent Tica)]MBA1333020.1 biopolymer transporter ExbB [Candidatus Endoriftia persephone str. Guaymas]USF88966.1 MotA/TolQ/ExbB proton channel family protein [Candidatus Endoriftia persephone]
MFEFVKAGGWLMLPIITCSVVASAIVLERFWSLQRKRVMPEFLMQQILRLHRDKKLDKADLKTLRESSPLGRILAAGLLNHRHSKEVMKESIEEVGRQVVLELERYLNTLGTIASITPLLGLLGTVIGMIKVFGAIVTAGVGNPGILAGGISEALITTATGLSVAIPSLMFHRYFMGLVEKLVVAMEEQALKLIEVIHGEREVTSE